MSYYPIPAQQYHHQHQQGSIPSNIYPPQHQHQFHRNNNNNNIHNNNYNNNNHHHHNNNNNNNNNSYPSDIDPYSTHSQDLSYNLYEREQEFSMDDYQYQIPEQQRFQTRGLNQYSDEFRYPSHQQSHYPNSNHQHQQPPQQQQQQHLNSLREHHGVYGIPPSGRKGQQNQGNLQI